MLRVQCIIPAVSAWMVLCLLALASPFAAHAAGDVPNDCDRLAGHPADPQRVGIGVVDSNVRPTIAIRACTDAVGRDSESARLRFQLGRAYWLSIGSQEKSVEEFTRAANLGSAAALSYLAEIVAGKGKLREPDMELALDYATRSADGGFVPAKALVKNLRKVGRDGHSRLIADVVSKSEAVATAQLLYPIDISGYTTDSITEDDLGYCLKLAHRANARLRSKRAARSTNDTDRAPTEAEVCLAMAFRQNDLIQAGARAMTRQKEHYLEMARSGSFKNQNRSFAETTKNLSAALGGLVGAVSEATGALDTKFVIEEFTLYGCGKNYGGAGYFCDYFIRATAIGGMAGAAMEGFAGFVEPGRGQRGNAQVAFNPDAGVWYVLRESR